MQKRYAKENLVAVSVNLDEEPEKGEVRDRVLKFLRSQNATFTNLALDEKPEVWQEKLKFDGPPCVYVFSPEGKIEKQFKDEFTYDDVEKVVKGLLEKK